MELKVLEDKEICQVNGGLGTFGTIIAVVGFVAAVEPFIEAVKDVHRGYTENRRG